MLSELFYSSLKEKRNTEDKVQGFEAATRAIHYFQSRFCGFG